MSEERNDVVTQFQTISNKLKKKRILKKPNVAEASQQFENLGIICEREELPQYAGLSYQAAAKCQSSLGNQLEEGFLLLKSSRQYMTSHLKLVSHNMVSTDENLHHSLACYRESLEKIKNNLDSNTPSNKTLIGGIRLEMADTLKNKLGRISEAAVEYGKALDAFSDSAIEKLHCLHTLSSCRIEMGNFDEALKLTNEIVTETQGLPNSGFKQDILLNAEITRILLLLILQPTPQQITPSAAQVLEKYAWVETLGNNEVTDLQTTLNSIGLPMLDENLFVCLQSLVMACQSSDTDSLVLLENDIINFLSNEQRNLLRILVKLMLQKAK